MSQLCVKRETALKLKQVGFNEACYWYSTEYKAFSFSGKNSDCMPDSVTLPTYQQTIAWLFEKQCHLHDYWLSDERKWGCDLYSRKGDLIYKADKLFENIEDAWDIAIAESLKMLD